MNKRAFSGASALAAIGVLSAGAMAQSSTWSLQGSALEYGSESAGFIGSYGDLEPTLGSDALPNGLRVFGTGLEPESDSGIRAFTIGGSQYAVNDPSGDLVDTRLRIFGRAEFDSPLAWDSSIWSLPTTFKYSFFLTGGTLDVKKVQTSFAAIDPDGVTQAAVGSSGAGEGSFGGGEVFEVGYVDNFGNNPMVKFIDWEVSFVFRWSGFDEADSMWLSIPQSSVDLGVVPAPGAALGLIGGALLASRRRR
jgi:hypothetical protein